MLILKLISSVCTLGYTDDGLPVPCETYKVEVIRRITGHPDATTKFIGEIVELEEKNNYDDNDDGEEEVALATDAQNTDATRFNIWLKNILQDVQVTLETEDNGDRDNIMYNPKFSKYFMNLCKLLPLWSAICVHKFVGAELIASSGNVESLFHDLKLSHKDIIPCSADKFVQADLNLIDGMVKDASQHYIEFIENIEFSAENNSTESHTDIIVDDKHLEDTAETSINDYNEETTTGEAETQVRMDIDIEDVISDAAAPCNENETSSECPACSQGNFPTGAHKCYKCDKNVHILPGCSTSCGDEEGYGERRIGI